MLCHGCSVSPSDPHPFYTKYFVTLPSLSEIRGRDEIISLHIQFKYNYVYVCMQV